MNPGLVVGGYVFVVPTPRLPDHEDVLPPTFLTISNDIQVDLPQPEFMDWFVDYDHARAAGVSAPEATLLAVSLAPNDARTLMEEDLEGNLPWFDLLRSGQSLPTNAELLGYEIVGVEASFGFHSWHCYGCAPDARRELGTRLNGHGLLGTYEEAEAVLNWMLTRPPEHSVPPIPWIVVALAPA
ncbi:MAG: hypothetical protein ACT4QF_00425 [Sporichthyaceae bacterium]